MENIGDIIYFIKPHKIISYSYSTYDFKLIKPYIICEKTLTGIIVKDLQDFDQDSLYRNRYFIHKVDFNKTISHEEFIRLNRERKLRELGIECEQVYDRKEPF